MSELNDGIVDIRGKQYKTVGRRIADFRSDHPDHTITCEIVQNEGDIVVMKASISDISGRVIATGYAEENRSVGNINKTSALENAETSAVGRALAFLGLGGTEVASADEIANAMKQQDALVEIEKYKALGAALREHMAEVLQIKEMLAESPDTESGLVDMESAAQLWFELPDDAKAALWISTTAGGPWETREREILKRSDFREAYYGSND